MVFPAFSGRFASSRAAQVAAPDEMPGQNARLPCEGAAAGECILVLHGDDLIVHVSVEHLGHKARADSLDGVGRGRSA